MYRAVTLHALRHGLFAPDGSLETEMLREQMPQIEVSFRLDPETQFPQTTHANVWKTPFVRSR